MAAAKHLPSEDQFLCSICLDVFTDPVTTPCGHNFCKTCIQTHWDAQNQYHCPLCQKEFLTKPDLNINTFISEMVTKFRQEAQQEAQQEVGCSSSLGDNESQPGEVPCDVCTGTKQKALKSCLVCLVSYCRAHLEPHQTVPGLKRHQLTDPVENLEDRMCVKHNKPLELFCKTDQMCVCVLCPVLDHKNHEFVPLIEEFDKKKDNLEKTEAEIQQMIQERRLKVEEFQNSVRQSKENADGEIAKGFQIFTSLKESFERGLNDFVNRIEEKQKTTEKQAEDSIKELEQEISDLKKRSADVEKLLLFEDHLHFLQTFQSLNLHQPPPTKDWTQVSVHPPSHEGTVVRAVVQLEETTSQMGKKVLAAELRRVQKYRQDVRLDCDKIQNEAEKQHRWRELICDDYDKGFLGEHRIRSGRFYFEVQVTLGTKWFLGVASDSNVNKQATSVRPANGYWVLSLDDGNKYKALADRPVSLRVKSQPKKVGVFVDYDEGLVSFYDVDTADLIYSFTGCSFDGTLRLYFKKCPNDEFRASAPAANFIPQVEPAPTQMFKIEKYHIDIPTVKKKVAKKKAPIKIHLDFD